ncbi:MAG: FAD-dependent oxidoreductase [Gammaproteobacteria bacterium]|nr:FAD-dependent oxidoreductase [Gammaproteobacteria bacterium]
MLDVLIVGQGLAGSLLASELIAQGQRIRVLDNRHRHASSMVAAGLINPVTGRRLVKSPYTEDWMAAAWSCYRQLESELGLALLFEKPMWRLFTSAKQREIWQQRQSQEEYAGFLSTPDTEPASLYQAPHGMGKVSHTAYVDTKVMLTALRDWLEQQDAYLEREVEYEAIHPRQGHVEVDGLKARQLVFCEGYRGMHNPWFGQLPLTPVKGEILTLSHDTDLPDLIANFGKWLLPIDTNLFKLGATYDWEHLDNVPTQAARQHLLDALAKVLSHPLSTTLQAHEAGVRPNSRDRLPLIGPHPDHRSLYIFNGFGSRGALMIPYYASQLAAHMRQGEALPSHCDIARFEDRH